MNNKEIKIIKEERDVFLIQTSALANYARLCAKLNEAPKSYVVEMLYNCTDIKALKESDEMFRTQLKKLN